MARIVEYTFDPFEMANRDKPKGRDRIDALKELEDFVKVEILDFATSGQSPVAGHRKFKQLTKEYAKREKGGRRLANLTLTGDMLDDLDTKIRGNRITVGIRGEEGDKAEGHNQLKDGHDFLPIRRFIPDTKEIFKKQIISGMQEIIDRHSEDDDG